MIPGRKGAWSDAEMLEALAMRHEAGLTAKQIALRFGTSRNAVLGVFHRVRTESAPGAAGDGTMPADWWRVGLSRRRQSVGSS